MTRYAGNHGLPSSNSSVPNDLVQSEKDRLFSDMLAGFRYCRLAMGLYFRGLTPDNKTIVERWPGQAAGLAEVGGWWCGGGGEGMAGAEGLVIHRVGLLLQACRFAARAVASGWAPLAAPHPF